MSSLFDIGPEKNAGSQFRVYMLTLNYFYSIAKFFRLIAYKNLVLIFLGEIVYHPIFPISSKEGVFAKVTYFEHGNQFSEGIDKVLGYVIC